MRKSIKKMVVSLLAASMVVGTMTTAFAADETTTAAPEEFTADMPDGEVHYTIAGGMTKVAWNPSAKDNELEKTVWDGVYKTTLTLPAFVEADEWKNRFKICKIDNITAGGWTGSLCLGTSMYEDNQTTFRIENAEEGTFTIYFDANTGAVVVLDKDSKAVDYNFSWVGYDNEVKYTTPSQFAAFDISTLAQDKLKVTDKPDIAALNAALSTKVEGKDLSNADLYADGSVKYTCAGGSTPFAWGPLSSANEMKETAIKGVFAMKMTFPAYVEADEWKSRFKICKLDDITCEGGWTGSLCLGTQMYEDNQTTFRVQCAEETPATVYFQPSTGAVVILDDNGNEVEYNFSWVGYDNEVVYTTVKDFANFDISTLAQDKLKVTDKPDLVTLNAALVKTIKEGPKDPVENPTDAPKATDAAAATTEAPAANGQATTAKATTPKTGDVAPVALMVTLFAAVVAVAVVAKKKEA